MAAELSSLNAKTNAEKIFFGVSLIPFNNGVGWLAYPQEFWNYTDEPVVLASRLLQSAAAISVYTGNTLTANRRIEFYINQTTQGTEEVYIVYLIAARNK